jgi:hypothetical protein
MSRQPDREHDQTDRFVARVVAAIKAELDQVHRELHAAHAKLDAIHADQQELKTMSGSLADQLTAALASITADVDVVSNEVTALLAALQGNVGQPVTQAMVDSATAIDQRLKAIPPAPIA